MTSSPFVPDAFDVPRELAAGAFRLAPLGPEHNAGDHQAWGSSIEHIRATPGFAGWGWPPDEMSLEENGRDLERHARDFAERRGFTYTVLAPDGGEVLGCVYIYPARDERHDARVRSWVRESAAALDAPLHDAVARWLDERWPFQRVDYDARPGDTA